jgi:hypothetical protein
MEVSLFLAKVLAIYFIILSIAFLCRPVRTKVIIVAWKDNPPLLLLSGVLALLVGSLMVVAHNVWEMHWPVVITIVAWLSLIKGVLILFFPQCYQDALTKFLACKVSYHVNMIIVLLLGIFLAYHGFYLEY